MLIKIDSIAAASYHTRLKTTSILLFRSVRWTKWNNSLQYIFGEIILIITHLPPYTTSECFFDIREESWYKLDFVRLKYWDTISRLKHLSWATFETEIILWSKKSQLNYQLLDYWRKRQINRLFSYPLMLMYNMIYFTWTWNITGTAAKIIQFLKAI